MAVKKRIVFSTLAFILAASFAIINFLASKDYVLEMINKQEDLSFDYFIDKFVPGAFFDNVKEFPIEELEDVADPKFVIAKFKDFKIKNSNIIKKYLIKQDLHILLPDSLKDLETKKITKDSDINISVLPPMLNKSGKPKVSRNSNILSKIPANSLIYLPKPFVVAGKFHPELYPHDTSYIISALLRSREIFRNFQLIDLAKNQLDNFAYEIKNFGFPLNANRAYYLTRSQENMLVTNVFEYFDASNDLAWLKKHGLKLANSVFSYWTDDLSKINTAWGTAYGFNAYGEGPCVEVMASYKAHRYYYDKVLQKLVEWSLNPDAAPDYAKGFDYSKVINKLDGVEIKRAKFSGEPILNYMGEHYALTPEFFKNDRASRVSGFDSNHLFGPFNAFIDQFIPAAHNILLYRQAKDLSTMHTLAFDASSAYKYDVIATSLKRVILNRLWDQETGMIYDYDIEQKRLRKEYPFLASAYALWAKLFNVRNYSEKAKLLSLVKFLEDNFEGSYGLHASLHETGLHWDKPYVWPIQQAIVVQGLRYYSDQLVAVGDTENSEKLIAFADRISFKFLKANYYDWISSKGKSIKEKVMDHSENLLTGYSNSENYSWNLMAIIDLYQSLSEESQKKLRELKVN